MQYSKANDVNDDYWKWKDGIPAYIMVEHADGSLDIEATVVKTKESYMEDQTRAERDRRRSVMTPPKLQRMRRIG